MGKRLAVLVVACGLVGGASGRLNAQCAGDMPVLAAGDPIIAVVNTNNNGSLTDPQDCKVMAAVGSAGTGTGIFATAPISITAEQEPDEDTSLQYCEETYCGDAMQDGDMFEIDASADPSSLINSIIKLLPSLSSSSPSPSPSFAVGGAQGMGPEIGAAELRDPFGSFRGEGFLCEAGGPKVQITLDNGLGLLLDIESFPSPANETHKCVQDVPLEIGFGEFTMNDVCFPTDDNGNIPVGTSDSQFFIIRFDNLPSCTGVGRQAAPTASEWGLVFLALSLLGGGSWLLSRRQSFATSLPRP